VRGAAPDGGQVQLLVREARNGLALQRNPLSPPHGAGSGPQPLAPARELGDGRPCRAEPRLSAVGPDAVGLGLACRTGTRCWSPFCPSPAQPRWGAVTLDAHRAPACHRAGLREGAALPCCAWALRSEGKTRLDSGCKSDLLLLIPFGCKNYWRVGQTGT